MLQDAQRTSAPSAFSVSISTAVWIVMCSEPAIARALQRLGGANSARVAIRPGISVSAMAISFAAPARQPDVGDGIVFYVVHGHFPPLRALAYQLSGRRGNKAYKANLYMRPFRQRAE